MTSDRPFRSALDWVSRAVQAGTLPCAVFGAANSGGIVALEAFGAHDGRTTGVDDYFTLFSVTKPVTGLIALRLVERGLLSLHQPLRDAVPEFGSGRSDEVTLWHLMTHTSGILERSLAPAEGLRQHLVSAPAVFVAGSAVQYSNLAFAGIAELIRHASGRPFDEHLDDLPGAGGMTFDVACEPADVTGKDELGIDFDRYLRLRHPAGGLFARAAGLLDLGSSLLRADGRPVHSSTLARSTCPQTSGLPNLNPDPVAGASQLWGLVWSLRYESPALLERNVYGHGGWSGCQWWIYPEYDACLVFLTNGLTPASTGVDLDNLLNAFASGLDGSPAGRPGARPSRA